VSFDRADGVRRLAAEPFDIVVIGGGITGAGCALDAASRGLRTALVERYDFASGTSSKSSKLVHGGLRYLQQREIGLVYEALAERQVLRRIAPHLVRVQPFLLPVFTSDGLINRRLARALGTAMWMYDMTGGLRIGKLHRRISKDAALAHMPTLRGSRLASAYIYYDTRADDARLTLTIARTAAEHGAAVVNDAAVVGFEKDVAGRVQGVRVVIDGAELSISTRAVVNATGVWSDNVRALDEGRNPDSIRPAKGVHITVPWAKVRNDIAAVIPVPKDRRSVFVVPWGDFTYIGTTDTDYDGPLDDPQCTPDDIAYLLRAINGAVTTPLNESDILGTWAGLRPLVKGAGSERTADLSRRHSVTTSASGVVTVTGGKLTTYRRMAADAVDTVARSLGTGAGKHSTERSRTARLVLSGARGWDTLDLSPHLSGRYGSNGEAVRRLVEEQPELATPIVPGLAYSKAEVVYAARDEMARSVDDVLARRTRARLLARDASADAASEVARLIGPVLGWSRAQEEASTAAYRALVDAERTSAQLPETALDAALGA
jgi:glycerol-3-phosphate dehydrogenase